MNDVQWWCSARGTTWSWEWQPYVGVWLFVAAFAAVYWAVARRRRADDAGPARTEGAATRRWRATAAVLGVASLWLTLDWPVGTLGAGYLAGVHAFQFVMLAMVVPPLLLLGVRREALARLHGRRRLGGFLRVATYPPLAMLVFTIVMVVTHVPRVVDGMMVSQAGSFVLDMAWFLSGLLFWWPLMVPVPARPRFVPPLRMLYLFFGTIGHMFIAMWLLLATFPVYATYELAPPFSGLTPVDDQQVAGGVMLLFGSPLVLVAITIIFFRWLGTGEERPRPAAGEAAPAAAAGGGVG